MYCTPAEVRQVATKLTATNETNPATDAILNDVIERASRMFDLLCGVEPEYFESAYHPVWESNHAYAVGDIVTPTTRNSHIYRATTAGTSGATEPVFPTGSGATVTNGTVVFTEHGADVVATNKIVYGDGTNYLRLPPYVPGTLNSTLTLPSGYTAPAFIEQNGYLVLTSSNGIAPPFERFNNLWWPGWWSGVPITISAIWGFPATPADVKHAVIEWTVNIWRDTDPSQLKIVGIDGQATVLREKAPPRVWEIARRYQAKVGPVFV